MFVETFVRMSYYSVIAENAMLSFLNVRQSFFPMSYSIPVFRGVRYFIQLIYLLTKSANSNFILIYAFMVNHLRDLILKNSALLNVFTQSLKQII